MRVLADTSVWIAHLQHTNRRLLRLVDHDDIVCHPYVVTELACGTPAKREALIDALSDFESPRIATQAELRHFIQRRKLYSQGCGMVDLALLASVSMSSDTQLWTLDKRLQALAQGLGCAYSPLMDR